MPYRITFAFDLFRSPRDERRSWATLGIMLDALYKTDALYLQAHPEIPPLSQLMKAGRVRYVPEPPGQEDWQDIPTTLEMGIGDFEDIEAWRAAESAVRGGGPRGLWRPRLRRGARDRIAARRVSGCGPYRITFALDLFNGPHERALSRKTLDVMLDALLKVDILYLRENPNTPPIYQATTRGMRVRYMEEPPGQEDWQDIPTFLCMGIGDCEDAACWRAAELQVKHGIAARPIFKEQQKPDGGMLYHILVRYPDGRIEDPSRILGMR